MRIKLISARAATTKPSTKPSTKPNMDRLHGHTESNQVREKDLYSQRSQGAVAVRDDRERESYRSRELGDRDVSRYEHDDRWNKRAPDAYSFNSDVDTDRFRDDENKRLRTSTDHNQNRDRDQNRDRYQNYDRDQNRDRDRDQNRYRDGDQNRYRDPDPSDRISRSSRFGR